MTMAGAGGDRGLLQRQTRATSASAHAPRFPVCQGVPPTPSAPCWSPLVGGLLVLAAWGLIGLVMSLAAYDWTWP